MSDPTRHRLAPLLALLALSACGTVERVRDAGPAPGPRFHPYVRRSVLGRSVQGRPIASVEVGRGSEVVLVMAAFHGDEGQGSYVADRLADYLSATGLVPSNRKVVIVPAVNPDGLAARTRCNNRGVDLNRNFPSANWQRGDTKGPGRHGVAPGSEPETQAVMATIEQLDPQIIVSIHTTSQGRHCVNYDGPAEALAKDMAQPNSFPVKPYIGYPTSGSLGSYAGLERQIPTITLELPQDESPAACWHHARDALLRAVAHDTHIGAPNHTH